jgi:hypothetical protein
MRWFMDLSYPLMKAMRSRRAVGAGNRPATAMGFEELRNATTRVCWSSLVPSAASRGAQQRKGSPASSRAPKQSAPSS